MTSDKRRAEIDTLRTKVGFALTRLETELEADGHSDDCALLCFAKECTEFHGCPVCAEDGE